MRRVEEIIADASVVGERRYAEGCAAGMIVALRLVLGEPYHGGTPMPGELDDDQERWARDALARLEEASP